MTPPEKRKSLYDVIKEKEIPSYETRPAQGRPAYNNPHHETKLVMKKKKGMIVSNLVTRIPQAWRIQSRDMALNHEVGIFKQKSKEYFYTLAITVIGMATALTWNEVVRAVIDTFFADRSAIYTKVYVALIATVAALIFTYILMRIRERR